MNNLPIGVFDSGIGGLTVLKELLKILPNESFVYLGDTARVPYGNRDPQTITGFSLELTNFLVKQKVKALVVACNTISAVALPKIKKIVNIPVIDVITPTVKFAMKTEGSIGLIATRATIESKAYDKEFEKFGIKIKSKTTPLLVPIVEEGLARSEIARIAARMYLENFNVDTLILGSTHYPLLRNVIGEVAGLKTQIIDSARPTALALSELLKSERLSSDSPKDADKIFVTDETKKTEEIADLFFEGKLPARLQKVKLQG